MKIDEKFITNENHEYVKELLNKVIIDGLNFKANNSTLPKEMPEKNGWK